MALMNKSLETGHTVFGEGALCPTFLVKTLYYTFTTEREFCTHLRNLVDFELLPVHRVVILEQNMFDVILWNRAKYFFS